MYDNLWSHNGMVRNTNTHNPTIHPLIREHTLSSSSSSLPPSVFATSQVVWLQDAAPGPEFLLRAVHTGSTNPARPRPPQLSAWCPWDTSPRGQAGRGSSRPVCRPSVSPRRPALVYCCCELWRRRGVCSVAVCLFFFKDRLVLL